MIDLEDLKKTMDEFLAETGWNPTQLGKVAMNDTRFVHEIRKGREPKERVRQKMVDFIATYRAEHRD